MTFPPISRFDTIFFFCPFSGTTNGGGGPSTTTRVQANSQCKIPSVHPETVKVQSSRLFLYMKTYVFPMLRNRQVNLCLPLHNKQQKIFQIHTKLIQAISRLLPASRFGTILLPSKISQARLGEWGTKGFFHNNKQRVQTNSQCKASFDSHASKPSSQSNLSRR